MSVFTLISSTLYRVSSQNAKPLKPLFTKLFEKNEQRKKVQPICMAYLRYVCCALSLSNTDRPDINDSTCMIKLISCLAVCLSHIQTLEFFSICKILLISKFRNSTSIYFRVTLMFQYHHRAIDKVRKINKRGITGARI